MKRNPKIPEYANYLGNCINSFDKDGDCVISELYSDTSDFACHEEESNKITREEFTKYVGEVNPELDKKISKNREYLSDDNRIFMIYDARRDIHYFFAPMSAIKRNPPTPGYKRSSSGTFAKAYIYPPEKRVEIVLQERKGIHGKFDMSREVMIVAKEIATPEIAAYFPDIIRKSFELIKTDVFEVIYEMPFYKSISISAFNKFSDGWMDRKYDEVEIVIFKAVRKVLNKTNARLLCE